MALALALAAYAGDDRLALDFHHELYRQAEAVVDGREAYSAPDADLSDRTNAVWPMAAVLPIVPLTYAAVRPSRTGSRRRSCSRRSSRRSSCSRVRDWRIYGVVLLWPATIEAVQTANASLPLTLLVALMWRYRDRAPIAGAALGYGVAVKLFLWPLVVWLALVGRLRAAAIAAVVAAASLLLLLPFTSLDDYVRLLRNLGETFEHESYTPFALLADLGVPDTAARVITVALGLGVLALAGRRRSLGLAIAAALVLSPIVWRHFFVLLLVPLALSRPRFDAVWLIPIGLWVGRRHVQRRTVADGSLPRARRADVRALRATPPGRARAHRLDHPRDRARDDLTLDVLRPPPRPDDARPRACCRSSSRSRCSRSRNGDGSLSVDFHNELYPEAKLLLDWENPFPEPGTTELGEGKNLIWPPLAAFLVSPFTLLSPVAADWAIALVGLACFMLSLRIVGVRDWRVYGVFALWPSVIGEIRTSHLTPVLCLLAALAWRYRDRTFAPGVAIGLAGAIKFFLWPLGVWLAAIGRRTAAATAVAIAGASVLLVLPFTGLDEYVRVLLELGRTFDQESYNPYGLLVQAGAPSEVGRAVTFVPRRRAARRLLALAEPRAGGRGGPRPLADRVARLLRGRGDPARGRPPATLGRLVRAARHLGAAERRDRRRQRLGQRQGDARLRHRAGRGRAGRAGDRVAREQSTEPSR